MSEFKCSAVIPLFNNRDYILRAVQSALTQTIAPLEVIVVDDGSTDGGAFCLEGIDAGMVRIITQRNQGVGAARNTGVRHASGEWIAFLDADDAWLPHHLEELYGLKQNFPHAQMLGTSFVELPTNQCPQSQVGHGKACMRREVDYFLEASRNVDFICSSAVAVRKTIFNTIGGFSGAYTGEDTEYWARVALYHSVAVSNRVTSIYYRGTEGVMETPVARRLPHEPVNRLEDVAPVLAMLCEKARKKPDLWKSNSVTKFVNGWLALCIKGDIYNGDIERARQLKGFMIQPVALKFRLWSLLSNFPRPSLIALVKLHKWRKR